VRRALPILLALLAGCGGEAEGGDERVEVPGREGAMKTAAHERARRRAFDGAPPVIPHESFGAECASCHGQRGVHVPELGFAPPSPHAATPGLSLLSRCTQCHVFAETTGVFVASSFAGRPQDLRRGERAYEGAPPVVPHAAFLRENCLACHSGPAAREEIRTTHPERENCLQCHALEGGRRDFTR